MVANNLRHLINYVDLLLVYIMLRPFHKENDVLLSLNDLVMINYNYYKSNHPNEHGDVGKDLKIVYKIYCIYGI